LGFNWALRSAEYFMLDSSTTAEGEGVREITYSG
jgi:hypothetical protein